MDEYEEANLYFSTQFKWHIHEETFQMLSANTWIAKVTTMFRIPRGEKEESTFYYLYELGGGQHFSMSEEVFLALKKL